MLDRINALRYKCSSMNISVFRDLSAIRFIRCYAELPFAPGFGSGGASIFFKTAEARCISEYTERTYSHNFLRPKKLNPLGIAAHPHSVQKAAESAYWEAIETEYIQNLKQTQTLHGLCLWKFKKFDIWITHLKPLGAMAIIRCHFKSTPMLFYSARPTVSGALIKCWEEYRNPYFYDIKPEVISSYTKAQKVLGADLIAQLETKMTVKSQMISDLSSFKLHADLFRHHHIVYLTKESV